MSTTIPKIILDTIDGTRLYNDDRVAGLYDDEVIGATVTYEKPGFEGLPHLEFDKATAKHGVSGVRILHQGVADAMGLILVHRSDAVNANLYPEMYPMGAVSQLVDVLDDFDPTPKPETVATFLFEVDQITDSKEGFSVQLSELGERNYRLGNGTAVLISKDRSLFDGFGPGEKVLITAQLASLTPTN